MSALFSAEPRFIRIVFNFSLTKRSEEGRTILIREDMFTFTLHNALVALYNPSNMRLEIYIRGYIEVSAGERWGSSSGEFFPPAYHCDRIFSYFSSVNVRQQYLTMQIKIFLLQCDYYNRGRLDKINQLDDRKITIHTEKVSCQS